LNVALVLAAVFTAIFIIAIIAALAALAIIMVVSFITSMLLPFLLVVGLLVGAWELFGDTIIEHFNWIGKKFWEAWDNIGTWLSEQWEALGVWWEENVTGPIETAWDDLWEGARESVQGAVDWFTRTFPRISQALGRVREAAGRAFDAMWNYFRQRATEAQSFFSGIWTSMTASVSGAGTNMRSAFEPFFTWMRSAWSTISEVATGMWTTLGEHASGIFTGMTEALQPLTDAFSGVGDFISTMWERVEGIVETVTDNLRRMFDRIGEAGLDNFTRIFEIVESLFGNSVNSVVGRDMELTTEEFENMRDRSINALETVFGTAEDLYGGSVNSVFADGFGETMEAAAEVSVSPDAARARQEALQGSGQLRAIHYPSWYMEDYRQRFDRRMGELVAAVSQVGVRGEAPVAAAAPRRGSRVASAPVRGLPTPGASPSGLRGS
jgi:phage-related protein